MWSVLSGKSNKSSLSSKSSRKKSDTAPSTHRRAASEASSSVRKQAHDEDRPDEPSNSYGTTQRRSRIEDDDSRTVSSYATAPASRMSDRFSSSTSTRPKSLTESAIRELAAVGDDLEDADARSDRRSKSGSEHRRKQRKQRSRSRSRDRLDKEEDRDRKKKDTGKSRGTRGVEESVRSERPYGPQRETSRGFDDFSAQVGAPGFSQFPGQYAGTNIGGPPSLQRPGASPLVSSQFPGQDPSQFSGPAFRPVRTASGTVYGLAADYYGDQGQSVSNQPGVRPDTPTLIIGAEPHLMAASAVPDPPVETGHGSAAEFYGGGSTQPSPASLPPTVSSSMSNKPPRPASSNPEKLSASSMGSAAAAAVTGATLAYAAGSSHNTSQTNGHHSSSTSYHQQGSGPPSNSTSSRPTAPHASSEPVIPTNAYYTSPQNGKPQRPGRPGKQSLQSNATLYAAAGAAGLAAGAFGSHHHHESQHYPPPSSMATQGGQASNYGGPSLPSYGNSDMALKHEHRGPISKFVDWWKDYEDVQKMEEYTEYIGVCRHCFDPRTGSHDAPRKHHYHRRGSSDSLRKRSNESLRRSTTHGSKYGRVDKESRYYSSDNDRRRKGTSWLGAGIAGYGLAKVGGALFNSSKDFDDTYSVRTGRRDDSSMPSVLRERHTRSRSADRRSSTSRGVIRDGRKQEYIYVRSKDGTENFGQTDVAAAARLASAPKQRSRQQSPRGAFVRHHSRQKAQSDKAATVRRKDSSRSRSRSHSPSLGEIFGFTTAEPRSSNRRSSNGSYLDDSGHKRSKSTGLLGGFFSTQPEMKRRDHYKKKKGFFNFGNGSSSSSSESHLAFSGGVSRRRSSPQRRPRRNSKDHLDATLLGIGATAAALAAAKRGSKPTKRKGEVIAVRERRVNDPRRTQKTDGQSPLSDDDEWVSESEVEDDSSVSSGLAFGDFDVKGKSPRHRPSMESLASQSSGTGKWGWRWGSKKDKKRRSPSPSFGNHNVELTSFTQPVVAHMGFSDSNASTPFRNESATSSSSNIQPMRYVDPILADDPMHVDPSRQSALSGPFPPQLPLVTSRPGPVPIQQPQPVSPVKQTVYATQAPFQPSYAAPSGSPVFSQRSHPPAPRRTQSSPMTSHLSRDAAIIGGVAAAAATASILSSSKPGKEDHSSNVRFELTEKQERKEKRDRRKDEDRNGADRRRADRERALKEEAERHAEESERFREHAEREERKRQQLIAEEEQKRIAAVRRESEQQAELDRRWEEERVAHERHQVEELERQNREAEFQRAQREREIEAQLEQSRQQLNQREGQTSTNTWTQPVAAGVAGATVGAILHGAERDGGIVEQDRTQPTYDARPIEPFSYSGSPLMDDDINDPNFFKRKRSLSDLEREKIFSDYENKYSDPSPSQADFFRPDILLREHAEGKTAVADPIDNNHVQVLNMPMNDLAHTSSDHPHLDGKGLKMPWSVPELKVIAPTPPRSYAGSVRSEKSPRASPIMKPPDLPEEKEAENDTVQPGSKGVSWGENQRHEYDVQTPESTRDQAYFPQHDKSGSEPAGLDEIVVEVLEPGEDVHTKTYKAEDLPSVPTAEPESTEREAFPEYLHDTGPETTYQNPILEAVSNLGFGLDSPGTEGMPPVRGFVEGEVDEPKPGEEEVPHVPGGFDNVGPETPPVFAEEEPFEAPLSKKDKKKRDKAAKRVPAIFDAVPTPEIDPEGVRDESGHATAFEVPISKKERKKRDKASKRETFDDEPPLDAGDVLYLLPGPVESAGREMDAHPTVESATVPDSESFLSKKDKKKRDKKAKRGMTEDDFSLTMEDTPAPLGPEFEPADREPAVEQDLEIPLSKKEMKKREKAAKLGLSEDDLSFSTPVEETILAFPESDLVAEPAFEMPLSKKARKKREKAAKLGLLEDESSPATPVEVTGIDPSGTEPEYFDLSISKKEQKKRDKAAKRGLISEDSLPVTPEVQVPGGSATPPDEPQDGFDLPLTKKEKKKREKEAAQRALLEDDSLPATPQAAELEPETLNEEYDVALSKKERKKLEKQAAQRALMQEDLASPLPESLESPGETPEEDFSVPLSKKERKKREKETARRALYEEEAASPRPEAEEHRSEVSQEFDTSLSKEGKNKRGDEDARSLVLENDTALPTPGFDEADFVTPQEEFDVPLTKKEMRKREKEAARKALFSENSPPGTPSVGESQSRAGSDYFEAPLSSKERKKQEKEARRRERDLASAAFENDRTREYHEPEFDSGGTTPGILNEVEALGVPLSGDTYGSLEDSTELKKPKKKSKKNRDRFSSPTAGSPLRSEVAFDDYVGSQSQSSNGSSGPRSLRDYVDGSFLGQQAEGEELPPLPASSPSSPTLAPELAPVNIPGIGILGHEASQEMSRDLDDVSYSQDNSLMTSSPASELPKAVGPAASPAADAASLSPLPASRPSSPIEVGSADDLPPLPESRPVSPTLEQTPQRPLISLRATSSTAIPLRFRRPPLSPQTPKDRSMSFTSPTVSSPLSPITTPRTRQGRPHSTEFKTNEFRPLYLLERNRKPSDVEEEKLPSLPSSKTTSRASSVEGSEEYESAVEYFDSTDRSNDFEDSVRSPGWTRQEEDILGSQQTTPKATEFPAHVLDIPREPKRHSQPEYYSWEDIEREQRLQDEASNQPASAQLQGPPTGVDTRDLRVDISFQGNEASPSFDNATHPSEQNALVTAPSDRPSLPEPVEQTEQSDPGLPLNLATLADNAGDAAGMHIQDVVHSEHDPLARDVWGDVSDEGDVAPFDQRELDGPIAPAVPAPEAARPPLSRSTSSKKGKKGKKGKTQKLGTSPPESSTPVELSPAELRRLREQDAFDAVATWAEPVPEPELSQRGPEEQSPSESVVADESFDAAPSFERATSTAAERVVEIDPQIEESNERPVSTLKGSQDVFSVTEQLSVSQPEPEVDFFMPTKKSKKAKESKQIDIWSNEPTQNRDAVEQEGAGVPSEFEAQKQMEPEPEFLVPVKKSKKGKKKQKVDLWADTLPTPDSNNNFVEGNNNRDMLVSPDSLQPQTESAFGLPEGNTLDDPQTEQSGEELQVEVPTEQFRLPEGPEDGPVDRDRSEVELSSSPVALNREREAIAEGSADMQSQQQPDNSKLPEQLPLPGEQDGDVTDMTQGYGEARQTPSLSTPPSGAQSRHAENDELTSAAPTETVEPVEEPDSSWFSWLPGKKKKGTKAKRTSVDIENPSSTSALLAAEEGLQPLSEDYAAHMPEDVVTRALSPGGQPLELPYNPDTELQSSEGALNSVVSRDADLEDTRLPGSGEPSEAGKGTTESVEEVQDQSGEHTVPELTVAPAAEDDFWPTFTTKKTKKGKKGKKSGAPAETSVTDSVTLETVRDAGLTERAVAEVDDQVVAPESTSLSGLIPEEVESEWALPSRMKGKKGKKAKKATPGFSHDEPQPMTQDTAAFISTPDIQPSTEVTTGESAFDQEDRQHPESLISQPTDALHKTKDSPISPDPTSAIDEPQPLGLEPIAAPPEVQPEPDADEIWASAVKAAKKGKKSKKSKRSGPGTPVESETPVIGGESVLRGPIGLSAAAGDNLVPGDPTKELSLHGTEQFVGNDTLPSLSDVRAGDPDSSKSAGIETDDWKLDVPQEPIESSHGTIQDVDIQPSPGDPTAELQEPPIQEVEEPWGIPVKLSKKDKKKAKKARTAVEPDRIADDLQEQPYETVQEFTQSFVPQVIDVPNSELADEYSRSQEIPVQEGEEFWDIPVKASKKDKKKAKKARADNDFEPANDGFQVIPSEIVPEPPQDNAPLATDMPEPGLQLTDTIPTGLSTPDAEGEWALPSKLSKKDRKKAKKAHAYEILDWADEMNEKDLQVNEGEPRAESPTRISQEQDISTFDEVPADRSAVEYVESRHQPGSNLQSTEVDMSGTPEGTPVESRPDSDDTWAAPAKKSKKDKKKAERANALEWEPEGTPTLSETLDVPAPQSGSQEQQLDEAEIITPRALGKQAEYEQVVSTTQPKPSSLLPQTDQSIDASLQPDAALQDAPVLEDEWAFTTKMSKKDRKKAKQVKALEWKAETETVPTEDPVVEVVPIAQDPVESMQMQMDEEAAVATASPDDKAEEGFSPEEPFRPSEDARDQGFEPETSALVSEVPEDQANSYEENNVKTIGAHQVGDVALAAAGPGVVSEEAEEADEAERGATPLKQSKKDKKKAKKAKLWGEAFPSETVLHPVEQRSGEEAALETGWTEQPAAVIVGEERLNRGVPNESTDEGPTAEVSALPGTSSEPYFEVVEPAVKQSKKEKRKAKKNKWAAFDEPEDTVDSPTLVEAEPDAQVLHHDSFENPTVIEEASVEPREVSDIVTDLASSPVVELSDAPLSVQPQKKSKKEKKKSRKTVFSWGEPETPADDRVDNSPPADTIERAHAEEKLSTEQFSRPSSPMPEPITLDQPGDHATTTTGMPQEDILPSEERTLEFDRDVEFAATLAAGLADTGFDPDVVVNDPTFHRRASPPGVVAEADPEEIFPLTAKKKKGKRSKKGTGDVVVGDDLLDTKDIAHSPIVDVPVHQPEAEADDFSATLEAGLAATGFSPDLLAERGVEATAFAEPDEDFWSAPTRKKKGKKGRKTSALTPESESSAPGEVATTTLPSQPEDTPFAVVEDITREASRENLGLLEEQPVQDVIAEPMPEEWTLPSKKKSKKSKKSGPLPLETGSDEQESGLPAHVSQPEEPSAATEMEVPRDVPTETLHSVEEQGQEVSLDPVTDDWALPSKKKGKKNKKNKMIGSELESSAPEDPAISLIDQPGDMSRADLPENINPIDEQRQRDIPVDVVIEEWAAPTKKKGKKSKKRQTLDWASEAAAPAEWEQTTTAPVDQPIPERLSEAPIDLEAASHSIRPGFLHTSEVSQSLPVMLDTSPTSAIHQHEADPNRENKIMEPAVQEVSQTGIGDAEKAAVAVAAGIGVASAFKSKATHGEEANIQPTMNMGEASESNDIQSNRDIPFASEPGWSFASLRDSGTQSLDSPIMRAPSPNTNPVRDSGYDDLMDRSTADRWSYGNHAQGEAPSVLPVSPILEGSEGTTWALPVEKHRDGERSERSLHPEEPVSPVSPIESTTKNRTSYLFQSPPGGRDTRQRGHDRTITAMEEVASSRNTETFRGPSGESTYERPVTPQPAESSSAPLSPPADSTGYVPRESPLSKRRPAVSDVGAEDRDSKAAKRTMSPPQAFRDRMGSLGSSPQTEGTVKPTKAAERAFSPQSRAAPWATIFEEDGKGGEGRLRLDTTQRLMSDMRSPSVQSNQSTTSAARFRAPESLRSASVTSNRTSTPTLRRIDRSMSGDLRAASRRGEARFSPAPTTITIEPPPTPPLQHDGPHNGGLAHSGNMANVYVSE